MVMLTLNVVCAGIWTAFLVSLFFGFEPHIAVVGGAFLIAAISFIKDALRS